MNKPIRAQSPTTPILKTVGRPAALPARTMPAAPPVYRPQAAPKVLQKKTATPLTPTPAASPKRQPAAPPVYRPQPTPKVLQRKVASPFALTDARARRVPVAPPVYRPEPGPAVQPKAAAAAVPPQGRAAACNPSALRPRCATPTIQMMKDDRKISKNQKKINARKEGEKKAKARKEGVTRRNLTGYGEQDNVGKKATNAFIDQGGVVGGHLSGNKMSGRNNNTDKGTKEFNEFKKEFSEQQKNVGGSDEGYVGTVNTGEKDEEELWAEAADAWNTAVSEEENGRTAMRQYLSKWPEMKDEAENILLAYSSNSPFERLF